MKRCWMFVVWLGSDEGHKEVCAGTWTSTRSGSCSRPSIAEAPVSVLAASRVRQIRASDVVVSG